MDCKAVKRAFLFSVEIISGENWNEVMYIGVEAMGGVNNGGVIFSLYFVVIVILGNCQRSSICYPPKNAPFMKGSLQILC